MTPTYGILLHLLNAPPHRFAQIRCISSTRNSSDSLRNNSSTALQEGKETAVIPGPAKELTQPNSTDLRNAPSVALQEGKETSVIPQPDKELTHVNSSGEAHMVDVGAKPGSRRVAIASATVIFSNPQSYRLIVANTNKKGDVLGVARIAGIMAAKRTSDLIPLCHPINISKVEVDVKLAGPQYDGPLSKLEAPHGLVTIQSHVECVGPTGVEMEAMTAVAGAALTVYDMCKAVDRAMRINSATLLYKSGGKSGLYVDEPWAKDVGQEFFVERNLEAPGGKTIER